MGGRPVKIGETWKDELPGGRGDKRKPSDFDPEQVKKGTKHEMEHTGDQKLAREIAIDPLSEDPKYYDYLKESIVPSMRSLFIESLLKEATLRDQFDESYPDGKCPRKWVEKLMRTHKMNWVDYAKENRLPLTIPEQVEWEPLLDWMGY